jgi:hypothetical protein
VVGRTTVVYMSRDRRIERPHADAVILELSSGLHTLRFSCVLRVYQDFQQESAINIVQCLLKGRCTRITFLEYESDWIETETGIPTFNLLEEFQQVNNET